MKSKIFSALKTLFFFGIGILLIWLVVKNLTEEQKEQIVKAFKEADYLWVIITIGLGILSNISRAVRWKMLLAPLGHDPKLFNTFSAVMIGYLANLAVPRLGEISRCGVLTKYEKIPFTQSFGTVITERIIDLLTLMILFVLALILEYEKIYYYASSRLIEPLKTKLSGGHTLLYLLIVAVAGIAGVIWLSRRKTNTTSVFSRIIAFIKGFLDGVKSIRNIKNPLLFVFHSVFIWSMYFLSAYLCLFCFPETSSLSLSATLVLFVFSGVAVIVTPGGIGAYQIIVAEIMSLYAVSLPIGYAYGWIGWLGQVFNIVLTALICLIFLPIKNKGDRFQTGS